ncbi:MAG: DUF3604 domain-containing protein [Anaerolineae bacterium]|nr:DUF3604 domain-containing protein [Anaerolineae bacterium]
MSVMGGVTRLEPVMLTQEGVHYLVANDGRKAYRSNPIMCSSAARAKLFWGDIHVHSQMSRCWEHLSRPPDLGYRYARDVVGLDFAALSDHSRSLDEPSWRAVREATQRHNSPGQFVTFLGFESSHATGRGGDVCVYYDTDDGEPYDLLPRRGHVGELFQLLEGRDALVIPHHMSRDEKRVSWKPEFYGGPEREPVAEVYSKWGASEFEGNPRPLMRAAHGPFYWQDGLARGWRLGAIGGTDSHATVAGGYGVEPTQFHPQPGLTAIYAEQLTRAALWDALKARRCYATSARRILLDFQVNDRWLGQEVYVDEDSTARLRRHLKVRAAGTTRIGDITVVRNNVPVFTHRGSELIEEFEWVDDEPFERIALRGEVANKAPFLYYYVRVTQADGERAWSSPIWLSEK